MRETVDESGDAARVRALLDAEGLGDLGPLGPGAEELADCVELYPTLRALLDDFADPRWAEELPSPGRAEA